MNTKLSPLGLILSLMFFALPASAAYTEIGTSAEASSSSVLAERYGLQNLTRIDDANAYKTDVEWYFGEGQTSAQIKVVDGYSAYNSTFGIIDSVGFTGILGSEKDTWTTISSDIFSDDKFHLGLLTPEQLTWSSNQQANADGLDHMITWLITGSEGGFSDNQIGNYIVAFEDLAGIAGSDRDFNDLILEINGLEDGIVEQAAVPEPAILALLGLGLLGLGFRSRGTAGAA